MPWLGITLVFLIADLVFGIKAAKTRGEHIRKSRAIRRTMGKLMDYICWICVAWTLGVSFGTPFHIPVLSVIVLAIIYGVELQSIFDNFFEYKGLKMRLNVIKFLSKVFGRDEIAESMENKD